MVYVDEDLSREVVGLLAWAAPLPGRIYRCHPARTQWWEGSWRPEED